jgi:hypothetical protein
LDEKREALELWALRLTSIVSTAMGSAKPSAEASDALKSKLVNGELGASWRQDDNWAMGQLSDGSIPMMTIAEARLDIRERDDQDRALEGLSEANKFAGRAE